jgi:glycosyltransferase involved in cell wall biosynthesis
MTNTKLEKAVLIVSKSKLGGAGRASSRLYTQMSYQGVNVEYYAEKTPADKPSKTFFYKYKLIKTVNYALMKFLELTNLEDLGPFNFDLLRTHHEKYISKLATNQNYLVNFHWVNGGFLSRSWLLRFNREFHSIWTLHDAWLVSGIGHYANLGASKRILKNPFARYLIKRNFEYKRRLMDSIKLFVTPSYWLKFELVKNGIDENKIHVIPNIVPFEVFHPINNRESCRQEFKFSSAVIQIGFIAGSRVDDPRKGLDILFEALSLLPENLQILLQLSIVGGATGNNHDKSILPVKIIGKISDDTVMNKFYNSIDLLVVPSRSDNLPQTATEAQSAGCPVLVANIGGCPETINPGISGQIFECNPESLSSVLAQTIINSSWLESARLEAVKFSRDRWDSKKITKKYSALFEASKSNQI